MSYLNLFNFSTILYILYTIIVIKLGYELDLNNFIYWKIGNFIVNDRYNNLIVAWLFLLNNYSLISVYFLTDEMCWLDLVFDNNVNITESLTNGFFVIHPVLVLFFFYLIIKLLTKFNYSIKSNFIILNNTKNIINLLSISLIAMFLGSYWANQEVGWGGWWSWDYVEIINLIYILYILTSIHKFNNKNVGGLFEKKEVVFVIIFLHLCVRFDFGESVHSFLESPADDSSVFDLSILVIPFIFSLLQNIKIKNDFRLVNSSVNFILIFLTTLLCIYLIDIEVTNVKSIFTWISIYIFTTIVVNSNKEITLCILDIYLFLLIKIFNVFLKAKNFKITLVHFLVLNLILLFHFDYLEFNLNYKSYDLLNYEITSYGDFFSKMQGIILGQSLDNWYTVSHIKDSWDFFISKEIFSYKYLYDRYGIFLGDGMRSYNNNLFQISIYTLFLYLYLLKLK